MKILTYSTLYPNQQLFRHGIFVHTRLRQLLKQTDVKAEVIAPVPFFPFRAERFGSYAKYAQVTPKEIIDDISISHPRYLSIPKVGMSIAPMLLALMTLPMVRRKLKESHFDIIDAHYFYPDGVAATIIGKLLDIPVTITARGSDINLFPRYSIPRKLIKWAIANCSHIITVSEALRKSVIQLAATPDKVTTLRNGVDTDFFKPAEDREALRKRLGLDNYTLLSVGNLIDLKGHDLVIKAMKKLDGMTLVIIGSGEKEKALKQLSEKLDVTDKVRFVGAIPQPQLIEYYAAADVLTLMSSREGWPNVLLEAMACGTPVIATAVGGTPEIVRPNSAGFLIDRSVEDIEMAVMNMYEQQPDRDKVKRYADQFSWLSTSNGQLDIFQSLSAKHSARTR